jgi:VanZ family protein
VTIPSQVLRQLWWAVGLLGVATAIYLSLMHNPPTLDVAQGDKLEHMAAYATLMLWFAQLATTRPRRLGTAASLVALGVALEYCQLATGYREFSYGDMVADALGVGAGLLLAPPRGPNLLDLAQRLLAPPRSG